MVIKEKDKVKYLANYYLCLYSNYLKAYLYSL